MPSGNPVISSFPSAGADTVISSHFRAKLDWWSILAISPALVPGRTATEPACTADASADAENTDSAAIPVRNSFFIAQHVLPLSGQCIFETALRHPSPLGPQRSDTG